MKETEPSSEAHLGRYSLIYRLQQFILGFVLISCLVWFLATCLFIPYILFYAPTRPAYPDEPESARLPGEDYGSGQMAGVTITMALFIDCLMLAGIHKMYKVQTEMMVPWLIFYALFILGMFGLALLLALKADNKLYALPPAVLAAVYLLVYVLVVVLYKMTHDHKSLMLTEMNRVALEPLDSPAQVVVELRPSAGGTPVVLARAPFQDPDAPCYFQWHRIRLSVSRSAGLKLVVDDQTPQAVPARDLPSGLGRSSGQLHFGRVVMANGQTSPFHGCAKNIQVNGRSVPISRFRQKGLVLLDSCPK